MDLAIRKALEAAIINAQYPTLNPNDDCFDAAHAGLEHWQKLVFYYRSNDDRDIGVEIVREYIDWIDALRRIAHQESLSDECRDEVEDALAEIQMHMNEIIKYVEHRIYPYGR